VDDLHDWTRLMSLPDVERTSDWIRHRVDVDRYLITSKAPRVDRQTSQRESVTKLDIEMPGAALAKQLLGETKSGRLTWKRMALNRLQGTRVAKVLIDSEPIGQLGEQNNNMMHYAGEIVGLLYTAKNTTVELCYALLLSAVEQCEYKPGAPERPPEQWWRMIVHSWQQEAAKQKVAEAKLEVVVQAKESIKDRVIRGQEAFDPVLRALNHKKKWSRIKTRLLVIRAGMSSYHLIRSDGSYSAEAVTANQVMAYSKQLGVNSLLPCASTKTLKDEVEDCSRIFTGKRVSYTGSDGGTLELNDRTGDMDFIKPVGYLNPDLGTKEDMFVDEWLMALAGGQYPRLVQWLSYAWEFRKPICGLVLTGPPNVGKSMLIQAICEGLSRPLYAKLGSLSAQYQPDLDATPFIVADESFLAGDAKGAPMDMAAFIRQAVSGEPQKVNNKYERNVTCTINYRLIAAGNSLSILDQIFYGKTLGGNDAEAIADRLFHIECQPAAGDVLRRLGGRTYTEDNEWVASTMGSRAKKLVAQYINAQFCNRDRQPVGRRFLVDGDGIHSALGQRLSMSASEVNAEIVTSVLDLLHSYELDDRMQKEVIHDRVHLTVLKAPLAKTIKSNQPRWTTSKVYRELSEVQSALAGSPPPSLMIRKGSAGRVIINMKWIRAAALETGYTEVAKRLTEL